MQMVSLSCHSECILMKCMFSREEVAGVSHEERKRRRRKRRRGVNVDVELGGMEKDR